MVCTASIGRVLLTAGLLAMVVAAPVSAEPPAEPEPSAQEGQESQDQANEGEQATDPGTESDKDKKEAWKAALWAEEDVNAPDAVEVVVTAERASQAQDAAAAAVSAVSAADIARQAPLDVTQVVEQVPGVDVQRMSPAGYGANVSIRGSSDFKPGGFGNRVLVLLDGRPVNAPDTHGVDWAALPLFDLSRVEVLRGPASALYGSTAMGGVVQLFTRKPVRGAELMSGWGFAGTQANQARMAASVSDAGDGWGFRLSGWLQDFDGIVAPGADGFRHNSDSFRGGGRLTGHWAPAEQHDLTAELSWLESAGGNPGFEGTSLASRSRRFERESLGTRLGWNFDPAGSLRIATDGYWNRAESRVSDPDGGTPNNYLTDRLGLRSVASFMLGELLVNTIGLEGEYQRVDGDIYALGEGPYDLIAGAVFLQSYLELPAGFELTGGLRLDGFSYSTHQRYVSVSPKLRMAHRPNEQTVVWLAANRGFRAPSIGELYLRYESLFGLNFQGNPEVQPEVLWAFELGARRVFLDGRLKAVLVGFWNEGFDTIEFDYRQLPVSALNLKGSRIFGIEASLMARPLSWLSVQANFSWMRARNLEDDGALLYRPDWKGALRICLRRWRTELWGQVRVVGERWYDDFIEAEYLDIPRRTLNAYVNADVGASYRLTSKLTLSAQVRNLADSKIYVIQNYPSSGREFYFEVRAAL